MNRDKKQLPDFRYWTLGENTYYVPAYASMIATGMAIVIGLASPMALFALTMWALW